MKIFGIKIELFSIIRDLLKNAVIIIMAALIGLMGVFIASRSVYSPEYTANATVVVNAKNSTTGSYSLFSISVEMTDVISRVLVEPSIKNKACEILNVDSFDGTLSAAVNTGTNFITLSVTSDSPQKSYELLNAVIETYPQVSDSVFENVVITVISMPRVPVAPSNSITNVNKLLVVAVCVLLVTGIIVILSVSRDTVKDEDDFKSKVDAKLLSAIPHEKKVFTLKERLQKKNKALLIHNNAFISLKFVENYHKIAAKIEHNNRHNGSKVFAITSVAENEGKSTTASNIAISLADRGHKVILVDIDCKKPALFKIFNKKYNEKAELSNLMNGVLKSSEYELIGYKNTPLYLALNTKPCDNYKEWIESGKLSRVISAFRSQVDFVIIDTAPIYIDACVTDIAKIAEETILVIRTDMAYTPAINDAVGTIEDVGGTVCGCVLNDVYPEFSLFKIAGADEGGYYYGRRYGKYGKYGKYEKYSRYSNPYLKDFQENDYS